MGTVVHLQGDEVPSVSCTLGCAVDCVTETVEELPRSMRLWLWAVYCANLREFDINEGDQIGAALVYWKLRKRGLSPKDAAFAAARWATDFVLPGILRHDF